MKHVGAQASSNDVATLGLLPGCNLLINGDFAINQRGFSGGALAAGAYGHDRWGAYNGGANYSVSSGQVTLNSGAICQVIESPGLGGLRVTVSVEAPSAPLTVTLGNGAGSAAVSGTITAGTGRRGVSLLVPAAVTGDLKVRISGPASFMRAKLEVGSVATRRDIMDTIRDSVAARRYYQSLYGGGTAAPGGNVTAFFQHSPVMRSTPASVWTTEFGSRIDGPYSDPSYEVIVGSTNSLGQFSGRVRSDAELPCTD